LATQPPYPTSASQYLCRDERVHSDQPASLGVSWAVVSRGILGYSSRYCSPGLPQISAGTFLNHERHGVSFQGYGRGSQIGLSKFANGMVHAFTNLDWRLRLYSSTALRVLYHWPSRPCRALSRPRSAEDQQGMPSDPRRPVRPGQVRCMVSRNDVSPVGECIWTPRIS
jgi:hypothetical protein